MWTVAPASQLQEHGPSGRLQPIPVQFGDVTCHRALMAKVLLQVHCGPCAAALLGQGTM